MILRLECLSRCDEKQASAVEGENTIVAIIDIAINVSPARPRSVHDLGKTEIISKANISPELRYMCKNPLSFFLLAIHTTIHALKHAQELQQPQASFRQSLFVVSQS